MINNKQLQTGLNSILSAKEVSNTGSIEPTKFYRSWSHKLISPDIYQPVIEKSDKTRKIEQVATWIKANPYARDFSTTSQESYQYPDQNTVQEWKKKTLHEVEVENEKHTAQNQAIDRMCKLCKERYGTAASMIKSFKKRAQDNLSLYELSEYLRRHNIADKISESDRKLVFDSINAHHTGEVSVQGFLKKIEEKEFIDHTHRHEVIKIKELLSEHMKEMLETKQTKQLESTTIDNDFEEKKKSKGIKNEQQLLQKAVGQKPFGLDINIDEFDDVLDKALKKNLNNINNNKVARFLRNSNVKLSEIPFYENRAIELDRLKNRAAMVDTVLESKEMKERYEELSKARLNHSLATVQDLNSSLPQISNGNGSPNIYSKNNNNNNIYDRKMNKSASENVVFAVRPSPLSSSLNNVNDNRQSKNLLRDSIKGLNIDDVVSLNEKNNNNNNNNNSNNNNNNNNNSNNTTQLQLTLKNINKLNNNNSNSDDYNNENLPIFNGNPSTNSRSVTPNLNRKNKHLPMHGYHNKESFSIKEDSINGSSISNSPLNTKNIEKKTFKKNQESNMPVVENNYINDSNSYNNYTSSENKDNYNNNNNNYNKNNKNTINNDDYNFNNNNKNNSDILDFHTSIIHSQHSMGRNKDPTKVLRVERIDPLTQQINSKKIHVKNPMDWSRVGVGGDRDENNIGYGHDLKDNFTTTTQSFYPPLYYEPSMPVQRDLVSQCEVAFKKKEFRRQERRARMEANLQITKTRMEYEEIHKQIKELRRVHSKVDSKIKYATNILLNDLHHVKYIPLERMARKANISASDKMWGGSLRHETDLVAPETRDFGTTYNTSFDSNVLVGSSI